MLFLAVGYLLLRYKLVGTSSLCLTPVRGVIGGQIGGKFEMTQPFLNKEIVIKLSCKCTKVINRGNDDLERTDIIPNWTVIVSDPFCLDASSRTPSGCTHDDSNP